MTELRQGSFLWKKSTASGSSGCVEVARAGEIIIVRDSKDPSGSSLTFSGEEWKEFLVSTRADRFNF